MQIQFVNVAGDLGGGTGLSGGSSGTVFFGVWQLPAVIHVAPSTDMFGMLFLPTSQLDLMPITLVASPSLE